MNCMKCGKKTEGTNVFCTECLAGMAQYPVKPGTVVHIPARPESVERKQSRIVRERTPEEQITALHKLVQALVICVAGLATTLAVVFGVLVYTLVDGTEPKLPQTPMGRNYSTSAPSEAE